MVELLVTLGVISIVAGLLLPAVQQSRESARRLKCQANPRQIGLAIQAYSTANNTLPPAMQNRRPYRGFHSIFARLLPYLDEVALYNGINFSTSTYPLDQPWLSNRTRGTQR